MSKMAARGQDLFTRLGSNPAAESKAAEEEVMDMNPLQLEHMLGYAGHFPKSILSIPNNENLIVRKAKHNNSPCSTPVVIQFPTHPPPSLQPELNRDYRRPF